MKDQVLEFYPKASVLEVKSEKEEDVTRIIQLVSEELKKLGIIERIQQKKAVLPKCQEEFQ